MTEFGRAVKEVEAALVRCAEVVVETPARVSSYDTDWVLSMHAELLAVCLHIEKGTLSEKILRFKQKAALPAEDRLYGPGMVAKIEALSKKTEEAIIELRNAISPFTEYIAKRDECTEKVAAIQTILEANMAEEAVLRGLIWSLEGEGFVRCEEYLGESVSWVGLMEEAKTEETAIAKRAANRERSKEKKRKKQSDLRDAATKRKLRESEAMQEAFEEAVDRLVRKEHRARDLVVEEEEAGFVVVASRAVLRDAKGEQGKGKAPKSPPRSPRSAASRRPEQQLSTPGCSTPPSAPSASPSQRRPRVGGAKEDPAHPVKRLQEAGLAQIPREVLDLPFDVTPLANTPSAELKNGANFVTIHIYRCLLTLRDGAGDFGSSADFVLAEELLTDRKAKKRFLLKTGRTATTTTTTDTTQPTLESDDEDDLLKAGSDPEGDEEEFGEHWVNPYLEDDEDEDAARRVLPVTASLGFVADMMKGCVVVMMSVGGAFAGGIFMDGDCVVHTTFSRYITRKKQGGRQSSQEGRHISVGSQIRKAQEIKYKEALAILLATWRVPLHHAKAIVLHAPSPVNRTPFYQQGLPSSCTLQPYLLVRKDPRVFAPPFTTHKPSFLEMKRVYESLFSCRFGQGSV